MNVRHDWMCAALLTLLLPASGTTAPKSIDSGASVAVLWSDDAGMELSFEVGQMEFQNVQFEGREYRVPVIPGEGCVGLEFTASACFQSGSPSLPALELPTISRLIAIPPGAEAVLSWDASEPQQIGSLVAQVSVPANDALVAQDSVPAGSLYPSSPVQLSAPGALRGFRIVSLSVHPVQVDAATGALYMRDDFRVSLTYRPAGDQDNPPSHRPKLSHNTERLLRSVLLNADEVLRDEAPTVAPMLYVIPDFNGVAEAIQPLVDWRRRKGIEAEIITVPTNASIVQVRNAILDRYNTAIERGSVPPDMVTLVGDADRVFADFMITSFDVGRQYIWETDYPYSLLEGDDLLPELAVARISARNLAELRQVVTKLVSYESDPYMEDAGWFTRGALLANDSRTGYSSIYLQRWARKLMMEVGFTAVDTFYFIHDSPADSEFVFDNFRRGISVFNYRGWAQFNGAFVPNSVQYMRNGRMLPVVLLPTCNSGDFMDHRIFDHGYSEEFLWADGGAIGTVGSSGYTHTNYNNVLDGGIINGLYRDQNWMLGWAHVQGKLELVRHFGVFDDVQDPQVPNLLVWEAIAYQSNLIGDAATEVWTGRPVAIEVNHPEELSLGAEGFTISAVDVERERSLVGATVTVMQDGELLQTQITDARGRAEFSFGKGVLEEGDIQLTVTRHNTQPFMADMEVVESEVFLGVRSWQIDDDEEGSSNGNGDGIPNPGEAIELTVWLGNFGSEAPQGRVESRLESVFTWHGHPARVVDGEDAVDQAPGMDDSAAVRFVVQMPPDLRHKQQLTFDLTVVQDSVPAWVSRFDLMSVAPKLTYVNHRFVPAQFNPGDTVYVDVTLRNEGGLPSQRMNATLSSQREVIVVFNENAEYPPLPLEGEDSLATARFRIYAHDLTIPGTKVNMSLQLEDEDDFTDSTGFGFVIGSPRDYTPFGPDAYGYACFDNADTSGWPEAAPRYQWVEIDPDSGGQGVDTELNDLGNEQDYSVLVDLPEDFRFRYYGQDFDRISICSNGWFAFGDESKLADFQNRRIPPALGPRAQVCAFWDDLINYVDRREERIGGVYYFYDEENHRFIIEWSRMRRYVGLDQNGRIRQGAENTFQAILYDAQHYQTYTGDGDIVFQYRVVNDERQVDPAEFDTPFATVGIVNLNGTDGMEYCYWDTYTPGAARLTNGRAIKFSTILFAVVGYVKGEIRDAATGNPIPGAEVRGNKGAYALSANDGGFLLRNVLVGDGYEFTAWAPGYNAQTVSPDTLGFTITEGDTLEVNFSLLHPEFILNRDSLRFDLQPGADAIARLTLTNSGNGPLEYTSRLDLGGEDVDLWERIGDQALLDITGDSRINGVEFFAGKIWITGSANNTPPNYFYRLNLEGALIDRISQPDRSFFGFRDITVAGDLLYGGDGSNLYGVDGDGVVRDSVAAPYELNLALAYDPDEDVFWTANGREVPLTAFDRQGNVVREIDLDLDIQGLSWFRDDVDGFPLYILSRDRTNPGLEVPQALLSKLDSETEDLRSIVPLGGLVSDQAGGMSVSSGYDPNRRVLLAIMNSNDDRLSVYYMGPNSTWIDFSPRTATIEASGSGLILVRANAVGMVSGDYRLVIRLLHNAAGEEHAINVHLNVDEHNNTDDAYPLPLAFDLQPNHPNPFNGMTTLKFTLPRDARARLGFYDLTGRLVETLLDAEMIAGSHAVSLDAGAYPAGVYIVKLQAGADSKAIKAVLVK